MIGFLNSSYILTAFAVSIRPIILLSAAYLVVQDISLFKNSLLDSQVLLFNTLFLNSDKSSTTICFIVTKHICLVTMKPITNRPKCLSSLYIFPVTRKLKLEKWFRHTKSGALVCAGN